jgi:hypothetical protein
MAVIKPGALMHSIKGKIEGSVFRKNTYGFTLYSNNWSKRGVTPQRSENHFIQASLTSSWRDLTPEERQTWYNQDYAAMYQQQNKVVPQSGSSKTIR